ncbi:hypothetical protein ACM01_28840 [Streptomyces viridochromogenes]|uniref:Uncharacterized protein n=1 Tax=Streptomyces viridochromogenes TaxID=1938 RepID=A0A0J7Z4Q1_STRVR|nr:hypothetical protein [Streptomyces viridochromogenes]KMS71121.1 hypothetical protein ACM01_28840 [Streptomyces viridochromogenes]KOG12006.1 hypothetical protein ADK36_35995 [Streptomyces viridochromogenes]KOG12211.1 hypothetical protein ADK35_34835 [Streptomyces viridochromogenes]
MSAGESSRFDASGERRTDSARWAVERLNPPNRLWGSNGPPTVVADGLDAPQGLAMARRFAGLAVAPDGALLLSGNGEGTVLRLTPRP